MENETEIEIKKRIFSNMPKATGKIRDFQIVSNYILRRTKSICDENNINFMLYAGSLLGAVRHQGFIPWDDDIDIAVLRSDYDKMFEVINSDRELSMKRYYRYSPDSAGYITKIKLKNSDNCYVDVFPWDYIGIQAGNENSIWRKTEDLCQEYHSILLTVFERNGLTVNNTKPEACDRIDNEIKELEKDYIQRFSNSFARTEKPSHICLGIDQEPIFRNDEKLRDCSLFLPIQKNVVSFEGDQYDSFNNYELFLQLYYGDIWRFPKSIEPSHLDEISEFTNDEKRILKETQTNS